MRDQTPLSSPMVETQYFASLQKKHRFVMYGVSVLSTFSFHLSPLCMGSLQALACASRRLLSRHPCKLLQLAHRIMVSGISSPTRNYATVYDSMIITSLQLCKKFCSRLEFWKMKGQPPLSFPNVSIGNPSKMDSRLHGNDRHHHLAMVWGHCKRQLA